MRWPIAPIASIAAAIGAMEQSAGDVAGVNAHAKGQTPCQPLSPHYYGVTVDASCHLVDTSLS